MSIFATSKLIIPPKPARNSPYIPKLRIRLRPNVNRNRTFRNEVSKVADDQNSKDLNNEYSCEYMNGSNSVSAEGSLHNSHVQDTQSENVLSGPSDSVTRRSSSKRRRAYATDEIDLFDPESVLTKLNLKVCAHVLLNKI